VKTSIIIPVYNDPEGLGVTVDSLLNQTATDYEVVIADNGSTDETAAVGGEFAQLTVFATSSKRKFKALTRLETPVSKLHGDILGFVDADMWVETDYVESITDKMTADDRDYMGCNVELVTDDGTIGRYRSTTGFDVEKIRPREAVRTNVLCRDPQAGVRRRRALRQPIAFKRDLEFGPPRPRGRLRPRVRARHHALSSRSVDGR